MNCVDQKGGTVRPGFGMLLGVVALILSVSSGLVAQEIVFVEEGEDWRYFKGTQEPPANWMSPVFSDLAWLQGPTGIGYADGDDATVLDDMEDLYMSFYARRAFSVPNIALVQTLHLHINWDDGFIAFLNGQEVARRNMGNAPDPVAHDVSATAGREANSFVAIDIGTGDLLQGGNVLAIQLHNVNLSSSDASLIPRLVANISLPPSGLACQRDGVDVDLTWTSPMTYDSIRVERDGLELDTIPGGSTDYTDVGHGGMDATYQVIGIRGGDELASGTCNLGCTESSVTCTLALVAGMTEATLTWDPPANVASIDIVRENEQLENIPGTATGYVDPNVESSQNEDDTEYDVIFNLSDGRTCTKHCGPITLCPENLSAQVVNGRMVLNWDNVVKAWENFEISRNDTLVDSLVPGNATTWTDVSLVPQVGETYDYLLHPIAVAGGELGNLAACDETVRVGYAPELGSYNPPAGGWDYEYNAASGQAQYNAVTGETGNLDGNWIRSIDRDLWDGSAPLDEGVAPDGVARGGVDIASRPGLGPCGTSSTSVLRILDPGTGGAFDEPNNARIVLGLDMGVTGENVLKSGITLTARLRTSPDAPAYMNPNPNSGDGNTISAGMGQVGVYYRDPAGVAADVGAAFSLQSNNNGGDIQFSSNPRADLDAMAIKQFKTIWMTIQEGLTPDTYNVNIYMNGDLTPSTQIGGAGIDLQDGSADFGATVENYIAIGSNVDGNDCMIEIDFVAYKLGVHVPSGSPCEGGGDPTFRRGDADDNGQVNITDGIFLLGYLFLGGETPPCMDAADADDNSDVSITDGIYILNALFTGGPQPLPPGPNNCGIDPSPDSLPNCFSVEC